MNIRITDLLNDYYDDDVKLETPAISAESRPPAAVKPKRSVAKTISLIAAVLMLAVTAGFVVKLRLSGAAPVGGALAGEELSSPETEALPTQTYYAFYLHLPIQVEGETVGYLENFELDMKAGDFHWSFTCPALRDYVEAAREAGEEPLSYAYDSSEEIMNALLSDETRNQLLTDTVEQVKTEYLHGASLHFTDGSVMALGEGFPVTVGYTGGIEAEGLWTLSFPGTFDASSIFDGGGITPDMTPQYLIVDGSQYEPAYAQALEAPEPVEDAEDAEVFDAELMEAQCGYFAYVQRGDALTFNYSLSPVPEDMARLVLDEDAPESLDFMEAVAGSDGYGKNARVLDYVNLKADGYDGETETLYLRGEADLAAYRAEYPGGMEGFSVLARLWSEDRSRVLIGWADTIPLTGLDGYAQGRYGPSVAPEVIDTITDLELTRLEITKTNVRFRFRFPTTETAHAIDIVEAIAAEDCLIVDTHQTCGPLPIGTIDGNIASTGPDEEEGYTVMEFAAPIQDPDGAPDPTDISSTSFLIIPNIVGRVVPGESDTGYLAAGLALPVSDGEGSAGVLVFFQLELVNGNYFWGVRDSALSALIEAAGYEGSLNSSLNAALRNEDVYNAHRALWNQLQETLGEPTLVFRDGTELRLGSGETSGYQEGYFTFRHNIFSEAEDQGVDIDDLTPDHLVIGGENHILAATLADGIVTPIID